MLETTYKTEMKILCTVQCTVRKCFTRRAGLVSLVKGAQLRYFELFWSPTN